MKRSSKSRKLLSSPDGQTIHGRLRPAIHPLTSKQGGSQIPVASRSHNQLAESVVQLVPAKSAGLFHAMRLTSGIPSLQSP